MEPLSFAFIISAFFAGIVTFLAPCTFPLVPGYLSFISGTGKTRSKIFFNSVLYVIGFSAVFILFGSLFGLGGSIFFQYRDILAKLGGLFVILFGLFLLAPAIAAKIPLLKFFVAERKGNFANKLTPGKPASSFLFGASFAFAWSPCVGPILGVVLTLAASSATVGQGAFLLLIFSLGLAVPFLLCALGIGWAFAHFGKIAKYLHFVSLAGGIFLVALGIMMVTNNFLFWTALVYRFFDFFNINYEEALLEFL
ncbi:MAG: cytochrome c biogenesis protein CcdA [Patescibacteria group bacterium]